MPAKRALGGITAGPAEDCIMLSDHEHLTSDRLIRALPKHRHVNAKFMRYRSGTHHMLTDDDDEQDDRDFDTTDTELGTALSDVEGEMQLQLWSRDSTPNKHEGSDDQEGEMIDDALYTAASSPAPGVESDSWIGDGKGKAVDPRETGLAGWVDAKRRWNERDEDVSDCDADDEDQVAEVVLKKRRKHTPTHLRLAKTNFGPTKSILEITSGMDGLGKGVSEITYTSIDEDDDVMVSAELFSAPPSPSPGPAMLQDSLCLARRSRNPPRLAHRKPRSAPQSSHNGPNPRRNDRARRSRQRAPQRIVSSGSDSAMITSDIEREMQEMESVDNVIARREHLCDFPVREPRARDTSRLRRTSPTSLLPMRETQRQFRQLARAGRVQAKAEVGQALLAAASAAQEARTARREHMRRFYENWQNPFRMASGLVSESSAFNFVPYDAAAADMLVRRSHLRQIRNLERKSRERDHRRIAADRCLNLTLAQPCRLPPPTITTPFAALLSLPEPEPESPSMEAEVEDALFAPSSPVSSVMSDPPEYEPPTPPLRLTLPRHLRPRPPPLAPSNEVPAYGWLAEQSGGSYNRRRTPSPPPPFNAQTDCQTLIAPHFIDEAEDDEDEVEADDVFRRNPSIRGAALAAVPVRPRLSNMREAVAAPAMPRIVGAFPEAGNLLPPVEILAPTPVHARSSFEAALDMEEGDEADDVLGDDNDDGHEELDSQPVLSTLGRLLRFWR